MDDATPEPGWSCFGGFRMVPVNGWVSAAGWFQTDGSPVTVFRSTVPTGSVTRSPTLNFRMAECL